jgi:glycosyltransferase involved in cell wall biosynthesis
VNLFPFEPDIYQIFSNVDILLMTSDNEGTPLTVMESSFAGVPCVGTDVGSMKEIVKNGVNGFLVVPNVELLADKIEELVRDTPALLSLKQTCKTYAEDHFNVRDYVVAHQNLYVSLVRSGKASLK